MKAEGRGNEDETERELFVGANPIIHSGSLENEKEGRVSGQ